MSGAAFLWRLAAAFCVVGSVILSAMSDPHADYALGAAAASALIAISLDLATIAERKP